MSRDSALAEAQQAVGVAPEAAAIATDNIAAMVVLIPFEPAAPEAA
jgi:hypothetical protein